MAHAIWSHDWTQAVITSVLTGCTTLWVKFSSSFMKEAEEEAARMGGGFARWLFAIRDKTAAALWKRITRFWWNRTANLEGRYYQWLIYTCRNLEAQGIDIDQTLPLKDVFIPLKIEQRSVKQTPASMIHGLSGTGHREIGDFLALMKTNSQQRHFAILGAPGSGKTTLLRYINLMYAHRDHRKLHPDAPRLIPVMLRLRDECLGIIDNPDLTLADLITKWINRLQQRFQPDRPLNIPSDWFAKRLREKWCLVMLDGLDEVADDHDRQQVSRWVDRQLQAYPETPFILTSRRPGYEKARLQQSVTVLAVQPFTLDQVKAFIHNWYLASQIKWEGKEDEGVKADAIQQANDLIEQIKQTPNLITLSTNPLLLTLIAKVHRNGNALPQNRVGLYREICQVLLEKRTRAKGLQTQYGADQKHSVLQPLALRLMQQQLPRFTLEQVTDLIREKLSKLPGTTPSPEAFLRQLREVDALISREQEGLYEFAHLSFQEYLASVEIKETQQSQLLVDLFQESEQENLAWWAETIRLYASQTNASDVVAAALDTPTVASISLAYDCLDEGIVDEPVRRRFYRQLSQWLDSTDSDNFCLATTVSLQRRFKANQLCRIDNSRAIDLRYITRAEYDLFLIETLGNGCSRSSQPANGPVTCTSLEEAILFCFWLTAKNPGGDIVDGRVLYRLPTDEEAKQYPVQDDQEQFSVWTSPDSPARSGIRVVKEKLVVAPRYRKLMEHLIGGDWKQADQETYRLMITAIGKQEGDYFTDKELLNFPCDELLAIDELWVACSSGKFGFSVQKDLYLSDAVGGVADGRYHEKAWAKFTAMNGWNKGIKYDISSPNGHLPKSGVSYGQGFSSLASRFVTLSR